MLSTSKKLIGRDSELDLLKSAISRFAAATASKAGLEIISISGAGGVGKTYLLDTVLDETQAALKQALILKIDASSEHLLKEFTLIFDQMFAPTELPPPAKSKHDYFPTTRSLIRRQHELIGMVESEISNNKNLSDQCKTMAKALYRLSPAIKYLPKIGPAAAMALKGLETIKAEDYIEPALDVLSSLQALKDETGFFSFPLTKTRLASLRHSPYEAISEAYLSDLSAMLQSYQRQDWFRFMHSAIEGVNRLFLIVDDFEAVGRVLGTFLVESLLPRLKNASFSTLVIFLGRDSVYDANKDFAHHLAGNIGGLIKLEPFSFVEGVKYLTDSGYSSREAAEWYQKSHGLPFILRLLVENRTDADKQSALFYKRFYERTTRWMSLEERKWLTPICYLDNVNEGTIKALLPQQDASRIIAWFESEASVRDVNSPVFTVTPYIRHMLLEYNRRKVGDPEHINLARIAQKAMREA
ncbi:hypothetical protein EI77_03464 [Prosthecobacter fusiformis]|uniref:AAA ATPase-like protein n=1 Tax=Prosthecobacter fusiformis TaxID=48464 RepID=A0A4R7RPA7_9BACT|nr:ATP-binding protein [Prosthecobacter fusiformis]TDU67262.1 hypothetical protein EI77_03464 [Prosthecobacter fusiformis]